MEPASIPRSLHEQTHVPDDLFVELVSAGAQARARGQHQLSKDSNGIVRLRLSGSRCGIGPSRPPRSFLRAGRVLGQQAPVARPTALVAPETVAETVGVAAAKEASPRFTALTRAREVAARVIGNCFFRRHGQARELQSNGEPLLDEVPEVQRRDVGSRGFGKLQEGSRAQARLARSWAY